jgi:hypothetical protein
MITGFGHKPHATNAINKIPPSQGNDWRTKCLPFTLRLTSHGALPAGG